MMIWKLDIIKDSENCVDALDGHDTMLVAEDVEKALEQINEIKGGK